MTDDARTLHAELSPTPFMPPEAVDAAGVVELDAPLGPERPARARNRRVRHPALWLSLAWLAVITLLAIGADFLPFADPNAISMGPSEPPGLRLDEPLGSDHLGRSLTSRIVFGARVSLAVSLGAVSIALAIGTTLGLLGGYLRGWFDSLLDIVVNAMLAFPPLVFLIAAAAILEPSVGTLIFSLAVLGIPMIVRVARANTITVASREYVTAARSMGMGRIRIIAREILPNILPSVLSFALVVVAALIVAEGSLSFLGLGVRPPTPSWGTMIAGAVPNLKDHPYQALVPTVVFFLTVLSLNTIGSWGRAATEGRPT